MFTQRCFIKKNNAELLRKLEEIGRTFVPNGYGEWNIPIEECEYLYCGDEPWQDGRLCFYTGKAMEPEDGIDCGENEELFLAISALRDDSDINQWFTDGICWELCGVDKACYEGWKNRYKTVAHKATVQELIEHFKTE